MASDRSPTAPTAPTLATTLQRSATVLSRPATATFAAALDGATFLAASRYVALAAFLAALLTIPIGSSVTLGIFLTNLLGFAGLAWLIHRVAETGENAAPLARVAYAVALHWAPLSVLSTAVITLLLLTGVGVSLAPIVALVTLLANLVLTYVGLGATVPSASAAARIALVLAGGLAAYGIDRFVWLLVG
mgnify:CR=1 FL=1